MLLLLTALATALDPCSLLDAKAIAAVQGAPPKQTKASEQPDGDFTTSQCFFTLPDFVKSVSFEVVTPNAGVRAGALRERWSKLSGEEKEAGEREEEEEGRRPPRQVLLDDDLLVDCRRGSEQRCTTFKGELHA